MPSSSNSSPPTHSFPAWLTVLIVVSVFALFFLVLFLALRGALFLRGFVRQKQPVVRRRDVEAQHDGRSSFTSSSHTSIAEPLPLYSKPPSYKSGESFSIPPGPGADSTTTAPSHHHLPSQSSMPSD